MYMYIFTKKEKKSTNRGRKREQEYESCFTCFRISFRVADVDGYSLIITEVEDTVLNVVLNVLGIIELLLVVNVQPDWR